MDRNTPSILISSFVKDSNPSSVTVALEDAKSIYAFCLEFADLAALTDIEFISDKTKEKINNDERTTVNNLLLIKLNPPTFNYFVKKTYIIQTKRDKTPLKTNTPRRMNSKLILTMSEVFNSLTPFPLSLKVDILSSEEAINLPKEIKDKNEISIKLLNLSNQKQRNNSNP